MARELTSPLQTRLFEAFRRELLASRRPVSGESRALWYQKFGESVSHVFAPRSITLRKPAHPAFMFKALVELESEDAERWEEIFQAIEREWREVFAPPSIELHTYAGFDWERMVFEFALLDGEAYLTGSVTVLRAPREDE